MLFTLSLLKYISLFTSPWFIKPLLLLKFKGLIRYFSTISFSWTPALNFWRDKSSNLHNLEHSLQETLWRRHPHFLPFNCEYLIHIFSLFLYFLCKMYILSSWITIVYSLEYITCSPLTRNRLLLAWITSQNLLWSRPLSLGPRPSWSRPLIRSKWNLPMLMGLVGSTTKGVTPLDSIH